MCVLCCGQEESIQEEGLSGGNPRKINWPGVETFILASRDITMVAESHFGREYLGFLLVIAGGQGIENLKRWSCLNCLGPAFSVLMTWLSAP